jgi:hypothetical protein
VVVTVRPRRAGLLAASALALAAGLVAGSVVMLDLQDGGGADARRPLGTPPSARAVPPPGPTPARDQVVLVWTPNGLPPGFADDVVGRPGVGLATVVRGDLLDLRSSADAAGTPVDQPPADMAIPLDAVAFDPASYPAFVPPSARSQFARLGPDEVLLGATSARLRRLDRGAVLDVGTGNALRVAGVVDDELIGAAEVALTWRGGEAVGVATERHLLLTPAPGTGRPALETAVHAALPDDVPVRVRGPGEAPWLRSSDAVLPQVLVKERFGEFAYRPGTDDGIVPEAGWERSAIVTAPVPLLGRVRCHRAVVDALRGALAELEEARLGYLLGLGANAGCYHPRRVRSVDPAPHAEPAVRLSRHAWGVAIDLNVDDNPTGLVSSQDRRLVTIMERWGFTWGGSWLVPDPAHFEYLRAPAP